ncbi:TonB family protein [Gilvimarinus xylanilyticus]|uniref:TonB family protein n=1 Tax=Gilvimarinus xylanilyticus TaxID=2944139 RepID=A0A9X2I2Y2_9GAMM|nr:TonB family protein [Gilvimarinus xylanilyticus]MCP8899858.1 TonB family protein [Gilvimarinus xylanilyticus]
MSRLIFALIIAAVCVTASAQGVRSSSAPVGVAPFVELERESFLMGLYAPGQPETAQAVIDTRGSRALVLKFTADRMTAGKLSRLFLQSIAINASPDMQRASASSLADFFNALKGSLRATDVLSISETTDGAGVRIYLNGQTLSSVEDPNFFNLLLLGWIGAVPPSTEFKAALLGASAGQDIERFMSIEPTAQRREVVASWLAPPEPQAPAQSSSQASATVSVVKAAQPLPEPPELASAAEVASHSTPAGEISAAVSSTVESPAEPEPDPSTEVAQAQSSAPAQEEQDLPNFSVESLQVLQDYTALLVKLTHQEIKYPRRAMKLRQTGSVRMAVVIDGNGELVDIQPLLESGYKQLDDAVEDAIEDAAPYPPVPDSLPAEHFEFVFPITFMLEQS